MFLSLLFTYNTPVCSFPLRQSGGGEEAGGWGGSEGRGRTSKVRRLVRRLLNGEREERGVCVEDDGSRRHRERI